MVSGNITNFVFRAANSVSWLHAHKEAILILNYHAVPDQRSFQSQMKLIQEMAFPVISFDELVRSKSSQSWPRLPAIVLTFDDCYRNQFTNAVPVLTDFGYPAMFFAVTRCLTGRPAAKSSHWAPSLPLMGKEEILELRRRGFGVGCHTRTHPNLAELDVPTQRQEIAIGKRELEEVIEEEVRFFSYPYGRYTADTIDTVKHSGYAAAVSVRVGAVHANDDLYLLKRLCVSCQATREQLRAQLTWVPRLAEIVRGIPKLAKVARTVLRWSHAAQRDAVAK